MARLSRAALVALVVLTSLVAEVRARERALFRPRPRRGVPPLVSFPRAPSLTRPLPFTPRARLQAAPHASNETHPARRPGGSVPTSRAPGGAARARTIDTFVVPRRRRARTRTRARARPARSASSGAWWTRTPSATPSASARTLPHPPEARVRPRTRAALPRGRRGRRSLRPPVATPGRLLGLLLGLLLGSRRGRGVVTDVDVARGDGRRRGRELRPPRAVPRGDGFGSADDRRRRRGGACLRRRRAGVLPGAASSPSADPRPPPPRATSQTSRGSAR